MSDERCRSLNNIPQTKLKNILFSIENSDGTIQDKSIKLTAVNRYYETNIPVLYWNLKIDHNFQANQKLIDIYNDYIKDLKKSYIEGKSFILASNYGTGKTSIITNILKIAVQKGYHCLYTTLSDIVNVLTCASNEERFLAKRELSMIDILVIDEIDIRFFNTESSNELFSKTLELILRTRIQNKLPVIGASNSPNFEKMFNNVFGESLGSLLKTIKIITTFGSDYREQLKII